MAVSLLADGPELRPVKSRACTGRKWKSEMGISLPFHLENRSPHRSAKVACLRRWMRGDSTGIADVDRASCPHLLF
jgi:hypothetical protein